MTVPTTVASICLGGLLIAGLLWLAVPILFGLPWIPTRRERIRRALGIAGVREGEVLFDLGAGDGRVLLMAAREFGARAIGVEISPLHCAVAWVRARLAGEAGRVAVRWGDYHKADLRQADVVFAYLTSREARRLAPILAAQLRRGARVVTISFDFAGWRPNAFDRENLIFLYVMPPGQGDLARLLGDEPSTG